MDDTIAAISTLVGESAINIIKISGKDSINIVNKIFSGKDLSSVPSHTIHYGFIMDEKEKVDEVLVSVFKAPKTYTTEDLVEINTHGGITSVNKILELVLLNGARLAEPGEFIKRAYLNGRIDLVEAEAVSDLISSKTELSRKISMNELTGKSSSLIRNLREDILSLIANIEVNIDYPEYEDALVVTKKILKEKSKIIEEKLKEILLKSENQKLLTNGINTTIIGRPNVGKSSLLNKLLNKEKAIVTDIEGTTRDIVEGNILLNGVVLNLYDTAGIRKTENIVEQIGVEKSLNTIDTSDLILFVLDGSNKLTKDDRKLLSKIDIKKSIIIVNKIDKGINIEKEELEKYDTVFVSIKENTGIDKIKEKIIEKFNLGLVNVNDYTYFSNSRQISIIKESLKIVKDINKEIEEYVEVDLIEIDIRKLWDKLGEILGESYQDDLLNEIFSKFCLGK